MPRFDDRVDRPVVGGRAVCPANRAASDRLHVRALPWSAFPASLKDDADAYLALRRDPDALLKASVAPLARSSIAKAALAIRQFASAAVASGIPLSSLTSLAALVDAPVFFDSLRVLVIRDGRARSHKLANIAATMSAIAAHWVGASADTVARMRKARAVLQPRQDGLRPALFDKIEPHLSPRPLRVLLRLPCKIMAEADRKAAWPRPRWAGVVRLAQAALAVELLLSCPMRPERLCQLHLRRHVVRQGKRRSGRAYVRRPGAATNGDREPVYQLSRQSAALLDHYVRHYFRRSTASGYLFAAWRSNRPRHYGGFHPMVRSAIRAHLGADLNPTDLRMIAGMLHVDRSPDRTEMVSRLLGHRSTEYTRRAFSRVTMPSNIAAYQRLVVGAR